MSHLLYLLASRVPTPIIIIRLRAPEPPDMREGEVEVGNLSDREKELYRMAEDLFWDALRLKALYKEERSRKLRELLLAESQYLCDECIRMEQELYSRIRFKFPSPYFAGKVRIRNDYKIVREKKGRRNYL
jgi:hypothetical protein